MEARGKRRGKETRAGRMAKQSATPSCESLLIDQEIAVKQAHRDSTPILRGSAPNKKNDHKKSEQNKFDAHPLFDKAVCLMIEREESLLGDILQHCGNLVHSASQQVFELKKELEINS